MKRLIIACVLALAAAQVQAGLVCCKNGVVQWTCPDAACRGSMGLACQGTIVDSSLCTGGPPPTPTPTPTPTPPVGPPVTITEVPITFPIVSFGYAPDCVAYKQAGDSFFCTPTIGDRIRLYSSPDGTHFFDQGVIFSAICGSWEDDGNSGDYCTGISNFVITRSRTNGIWIAAYTAGKSPNGAGSGGIGLAWASGQLTKDTRWTRYVNNPIVSERGGTAFAARLLRVSAPLPQSGAYDLKAVQPFAWLYVSDDDGRLYRLPIYDDGGIVAGTLQELPGLTGYVPLGFDWDGCWGFIGRDWNPASWGSIDVYSRGDCETTPGTKLATVKAVDLGYKAITGGALIERSPEGGIVGGPTLLLFPWDEWADQVDPKAVRFGPPLAHVPANQPTPAWAQSSNGVKP